MKTLSPTLATHGAGGLTTFCRCCRLDLRHGVVMSLTDLDRDLVFDAVSCMAAAGFTAIEFSCVCHRRTDRGRNPATREHWPLRR